MDITNSSQLQDILEKETEKVLEAVAERVTDVLKKRINENVYDVQDNSWYYNGTGKPTYKFRDLAWPWTDIKKSLNSLVKELYYDGSLMEYDKKTWKHGSRITKWGDAREHLAEILNKKGWTSSLFWKFTTPYWDAFIDDLFKRGMLRKFFLEEFEKRGFTIV